MNILIGASSVKKLPVYIGSSTYLNHVGVWCRRIHTCLQVPLLAISLECLVEVRHWDPVVDDGRRVIHWVAKQLIQVGVVLLLVEFLCLPSIDMLPVPDKDIEVWVEEQHDIFLHTLNVQWGWLRLWLFRGVHQQCWLDHDDAVFNALPHQTCPLEDGLVWWTVEGINDVAPPQVVSILWEQLDWGLQSKRVYVVSVVLCKPYGEFKQCPI